MAITTSQVIDQVATQNEQGYTIPTAIMNGGKLAQDSIASRCFVGQGFSKRLQMYMITYVVSTTGYNPIYVT